ncbi:MAG: tRNA 2-thiouridine(34) synthase MnmA [Ignavibacteria bacterium]|nr:tRNA 2-thiouridine(34) synthase MnmA [Ignavibacteria bacterium]
MQEDKKTVLVAMSGGVDSSVAAYLMKKENYNVIGVTLKTWEFNDSKQKKSGCCSLETIHRAQYVADQLGINHFVLDFTEIFNKTVIKDFISEYLSGRTPNPCVKCNKYIKWGVLLEKAESLGADFLVTGHYAKIKKLSNGRYTISVSEDKQKDQSYFLWILSQIALSKSLFPIGNYTKNEIRQIAKEVGLKSADTPDSQEICFIPDNDYSNFLLSKIENKNLEGDIIFRGKVIGKHKGYPFYTIGQRRGLNLSLGFPVYVKKIDAENNIIYVDEEKNILTKEFFVNQLNFLLVDKLVNSVDVIVKVRYKDSGTQAIIEQTEQDLIKVILKNPKKSVTPGQSAVFYVGEDILCGGIIKEIS